MIVKGFPDREIIINKRPYLYFGGTAYLGLPTNKVFKENLIKSLEKWGTFYGSSRNSNIKLAIYDGAEGLFSKQIGSEASLTVSSGTLAGKLVLEYLSSDKTSFYHLPKTHPAIIHKNSLPLMVRDKLRSNLFNDETERIVITADAILAMSVTPTSFDFLDEIPSHKKVTLVLDESHSLGIVGENGNGIFNSIFNKNLERKIMVSSLGKALGLSGGLIASDKAFIESLKEEELFISASCANPAYLEAYKLSQDTIRLQLQKLQDNLEFIFNGLELDTSFTYHRDYPVIYCNNQNLYDFLYENGMVITNFNYPNYKGKMNRIVITSNHTQEDLTKLKKLLVNFMQ